MLALMLAKLGGAETEDDPRSADFGKIKVGNNRWNFWGGFLPYVRLITQLITEHRKVTKTGAIVPVEREEILINFFRSKEAPFVGFLHDLIRGETFLGDELKLSDADRIALERLSPMFLTDLLEAIKDSGLAGIGIAFPSLFGVNVQTYSDNWNTNGDKLGLPGPILPLSGKSIVYDTKDYYSDTLRQVGAATLEMLKGKKGVPDRVLAIVEAREIKKGLDDLPNVALYSINANTEKGDTFEQYYAQWQQYEKLVAAGEQAIYVDFEGKTHKGDDALKAFRGDYTQAEKGNFSQTTYALLKEYHAITDDDAKKAFLKDNPELKLDPYDEWLKSHPEENAKLAIWGQAKLLTPEAVDIAARLAKELDIPPNALPPLTLPTTPEAIKGYKEYIIASDEFGPNSWEAKLALAQSEDLRKFLGREPIDTPIAALELKVKNRALFDQYEGLGDPESEFYIADNKERDKARAAMKDDPKNEEWTDDMRRIEALEKGSDTKTADAWVERGDITDEFGSMSAEVKLWLLDHPEVHKWALDSELLTDNGSDWDKAVLGLQVKNRKLDEEYAGLGDPLSPSYIADKTQRDEAQKKFKADNPLWVDDNRRVDAYKQGALPQVAESYVEYGKVADKFGASSAEAKLYRLDHPDLDIWAQGTSDNPTLGWKPIDDNRKVLEINAKYREQDAAYDALKTDAERAVYLAQNEEYRKDRRRREAYGKKDFPAELVETYVNYYELPEKGYRRERMLFENPTFASSLGLTAPQRVPAVQYDDITDQYRDQFDELEGNATFGSPYYIEDPVARAARDDELKFTTATRTYAGLTFTTKTLTEFGAAYYQREAYAEFTPDKYIKDAVGWKTLQAEGKPPAWKAQTGTDYWYEDDWYLMEHQDYYNDVYVGLLHHDRKDFSKLPQGTVAQSRAIFQDYLGYVAMPDSGTGSLTAKQNYRRAHPDLDWWMVNSLGYAPLKSGGATAPSGGGGVGAPIIP